MIFLYQSQVPPSDFRPRKLPRIVLPTFFVLSIEWSLGRRSIYSDKTDYRNLPKTHLKLKKRQYPYLYLSIPDDL